MPWQSFLDNLLAWSLQVLALAAIGAALPMLFRLRHPRTLLGYYHAVLLACLLLPIIQPWQRPIVTLPSAAGPEPAVEITTASLTVPQEPAAPAPATQAPPTPPATRPAIPWDLRTIIVALLATGIAARLGWMLLGLWRIRRYRISATPLYPIPESIQAAAAVTQANAVFCISPEVTGPVTLGWLTPVVLLPQSFADLSDEAQCAVACHELLHVRRNDWLVTLIEESLGALLWFHPAIWLLLARIRLTREQLVDAEAVRLTSAREPYIDALLSIARGKHLALDLAPAPLFLRRRHLTQRMHALLDDASTSPLRLITSYGSMTVLLTATAWLALGTFPLIGDPQFVTPPVAQQAAPPPATPAPIQAAAPPATPSPKQAPTPAPTPLTPASIYEPVTGILQAAATPDGRAAAIALVERAKQNAKLHMPDTPPFTLRVIFQAYGDLRYSGYGQMTENWRSGQNWRWTARLGDYNAAQYSANGRIGSTSITWPVPMRVQALRNAIFWAVRPTLVNFTIFTADVQWNGQPLRCVLIGPAASEPTPRRWTDEELCFDQAGLLRVYSYVPGSYIVYSYAQGRLFHGRPEPDQITFYNGATMVLDAQLDFTDLGDIDPNPPGTANEFFPPTLSLPLRFPKLHIDGSREATSEAIVHATLGPDNRAIEAEIVTATDSAVAQEALAFVRANALAYGAVPAKPIETMQREWFFTVRAR